MQKEEILRLIEQQKILVKSISSIANEIIDTIKGSVIGNENATKKMMEINDKSANIIPTFIKVSELLFKTFLMEHRLSGSSLVQKLEDIYVDGEIKSEYQPSEEEIMIMKDCINKVVGGKDADDIL